MELRQGAFIAFFEKVRLKGGTRVPMTEINLRQLEIFVAIVDYGSFTEAAKRLYLAQSTVSSHIRALEESLHVVLFRRKSKRNMVLTPDGKRVYQYARDILAKCTALRSDVMGDPRRELSIGASTVPAQSLLPGYLADFSAAWPDCCCTLRCGDSGQIHQLLLDGDIQLGFVGSSDDRQNLSYEPVAQDRLVMITPNTPEFAALQQKGVLGRDLLQHHPLIFREHGSGTQKVIDNYISRLRLDAHQMRVMAYVSDPAVLQQLVARGSGVSILSLLAVRAQVQAGHVLQFELDTQPLERSIYMAWRKKSTPSELARAFAAIVRSQAEKHLSPSIL